MIRSWVANVPPPPPWASNLWNWFKILSGIFLILGGIASFLSDLFAPSFYVTYELQEHPSPPRIVVETLSRTLASSQPRGTGTAFDEVKRWLNTPTSVVLEIVNSSDKEEIANIQVTIRGAIQKLYFVTDSQGTPLMTSPELPVENIPELVINLGPDRDLPIHHSETLILYGQFLPYFGPSIEVKSSNKGFAKVMQIESVFGWRSFVAENVPWIGGIALFAIAFFVLRSARRKGS